MARLAGMAFGLAMAWLAALAPAGAAEVRVFAASSLADALDAVADAFTAETGTAVVASYASSAAVARQIGEGAPADVVISADEAWMDHLAARGLIRPDSRFDLVGNALVLVAPAGAAPVLPIEPGFPLAVALGDGRLAVGEVTSVPAGRYARAALEALGAWEGVRDRLAEAENVRAALLLVARGEAPLGVVYATDAAAEPGVEVVGTFPPDSHPPIVYPAAAVAGAGDPAASFLAFLRGPQAAAVFDRLGFRAAAPPTGG